MTSRITINQLPPSEYPSKPVPDGYLLYRIDGLENCAVIVGCNAGDEDQLAVVRFPKAKTHYKLQEAGTECLVIHLAANEVPIPEAATVLAHHVREHPEDSLWLTLAPHQWITTMPYREADE